MSKVSQDELKTTGPDQPQPIQQRPRRGTEPDAQEQVIRSLREQVQDLFSQVSQLNNKLVQSYDRVSDLEDDLHVASSNVRASSVKISQLELERAQHLSALNTGLLVEKSHVTSELSRLMEKATEEAAQRGEAEIARAAIEKDLDDLSATLFGQANSMVAEARFARHLSEQKVDEAERALKGAEEAVGIMQQQMQALRAEKEEAEKNAQEMQALMGKGKWVQKYESPQSLTRSVRLLSTHVPYVEFLNFVSHLRSLHPTSPIPPAMPTLLQLPFLTRLSTEDSEPTVRLDLAPSLNWLSRRSVLSAIYTGQLTIEPISSSSLLSETSANASTTTIAGVNNSNDNVSCALCGTPVFPTTDALRSNPLRPPSLPFGMTHAPTNSTSWSTSLFKKTNLVSGTASQPSTPPLSPSRPTAPPHQPYPQQIYIFRLASQPTSAIASLPIPSLAKSPSPSLGPAHQNGSPNAGSPNQSTTIYPLCTNGWCLSRLRNTCTLWAFVRTGVVERIWEEELAPLPPPPPYVPATTPEKPPLPSRKRGIWGIASAFSEKAASWGEGDKDKDKGKKVSAQAVPETKKLPPPPPPMHPTVAGTTTEKSATVHAVPPPLPRRSQGRARNVVSPAQTSEGAETDSKPEDASKVASENAAKPIEDTAKQNAEIPRTSEPPVEETLKAPMEAIPTTDTPKESISSVPPQIKPGGGPPPLPQRARTPANVPLPDSRPVTPVLNPPSRTGSPAAPPPIPRRAAARGSRLSTGPGAPLAIPAPTTEPVVEAPPKEEGAIVPPAPAVVVESATPVVTSPIVEEAEKVVDGETIVDPANVPPVVIQDGPSPSSNSTPANGELSVSAAPVRPRMQSNESLVSDEEFVDAPTPTPELEQVLAKSDEATPVLPIAIKSNEDAEVEVDGDSTKVVAAEEEKGNVEVPEAEKETKEEPDTMIKVNGAGQHVVDREVVSGDKEKTTLEDEEKEGFVGNLTWEERTWKELVRLREEMFWARVGGLR
ncbi:hypothetical protein BDQ12DRAFT_683895 [Crucibulum laeve]|uniref:GDP/GTP exchange factor Sec2 N-terminal domain-containing protein n=1 Tax=Crucibulum laeve TaxID=68775 RepID=A0A5C3M1P4_9AGAR|nr:hypothetical protein BDQ12DRAFT_683895 [Crucibulum laeve]